MGPEHPAAHAVGHPHKLAVVMGRSGESLTYAELDAASNRVAHLLRANGLAVGDHVAVLLTNGLPWFEIVWGCLRAGIYVTPINWHLVAHEAGYIVADSGATALFADAALAPTVTALGRSLDGVRHRFAVGGDLAGFRSYAESTAEQPATPIDDEREGTWMFYSSGTTGRPKGIKPALPALGVGDPQPFGMLLQFLYGFTPTTMYLSPAPLYHAGPAGWTTQTHRLGGTVVVMEDFDPEHFLRLIEVHGITHTHVVPTHLIRMLKLPPHLRAAHELSTLTHMVHAAAPCPVEAKHAALEWLGPIVHEFYSGSEGVGFCTISPEEWLVRPGSVGKSLHGVLHILGDDGQEVAPGTEGEVWFESPHRFEYHGDPHKTAGAWNDRGWSTLGDIGYVDDAGYLYLTDRRANMIISGGVNIYPRQIEDALAMHPAVVDVAVIGTPHADLGEQVTAFVQRADDVLPEMALADTLLAHCRERLSGFTCPREIRFVASLPRMPNGKLLKRHLTPGFATVALPGGAEMPAKAPDVH